MLSLHQILTRSIVVFSGGLRPDPCVFLHIVEAILSARSGPPGAARGTRTLRWGPLQRMPWPT